MELSVSDLSHLSTWAYLVIGGVALGDAVVPVLPSETLVILGGVLAARGDLSLTVVIVVATIGATIGDNVSYHIGRVANREGKAPEDISGRFGRLLAWAEAALAARGASMLIIGRFIPGGRTALSFAAGYVRYPRVRFGATAFVAAAIWATYSGLIGLLGGRLFHDHWWAGLGLGLAVTAVITGLIELGRKVTGRNSSIAEKRAELRERRIARADRQAPADS